MNIGYARVSSDSQNTARQLDSLKAAGVEDRFLFIDEGKSGKNFDRPKYQAMKHSLRKDDVLFVHSLDRLGRNMFGIMEEWKEITERIGAEIVVLDMILLDTRNKAAGSIAPLVLSILGWVAQQERETTLKRQKEGIASAKKRGVHLGRPKTVTITEDFKAAYIEWKSGKITAVAAMKQAKITKTMFYKLVTRYESEGQLEAILD